MSAPLVVSIPHRLGREEAVRRLKGGLERAAASVPVLKVDEERWDGDQMFFRVRAVGQAASGHINVSDDHVRLEVMLPWLLQRFAEMAQIAIRDRGKLLLPKRDWCAIDSCGGGATKVSSKPAGPGFRQLVGNEFRGPSWQARRREPALSRHATRQAVRPSDPGRPSCLT